jgi:hypothetical protein
MVLLSGILIFMCLMGWAQKQIMELPQDPSPYEVERKERYAAHVQGLEKSRAAARRARKKAARAKRQSVSEDGGAQPSDLSTQPARSSQTTKVKSRSAKIPSRWESD